MSPAPINVSERNTLVGSLVLENRRLREEKAALEARNVVLEEQNRELKAENERLSAWRRNNV